MPDFQKRQKYSEVVEVVSIVAHKEKRHDESQENDVGQALLSSDVFGIASVIWVSLAKIDEGLHDSCGDYFGERISPPNREAEQPNPSTPGVARGDGC